MYITECALELFPDLTAHDQIETVEVRISHRREKNENLTAHVVVFDPPLQCVVMEGSDNPIS